MLALLGLGFLIWLWVDSLRAREQAVRGCADACKAMNVQFLDQTVALKKLWPARGESGRLGLRRWYTFEHSTDGADRWTGTAVLSGNRIEYLRMEHPDGPTLLEADVRGRLH